MPGDRPPLPDFDNPPVVEVALSVQFERLAAMSAAHLGLLWTEFRAQLPRTEEKPPLDPVREEFGSPKPRKVGVRLEVVEAPPVPRTWFLNEAGTELIQVQQDRFIHNWRKVGDADVYPRYERIRESFRHELGILADFLEREKLGGLQFNQCEVTYVNHIAGGEGWQRHGELANVFGLWSQRPPKTFLKEPEDATFSLRYRIPDLEGEPAGRLHVQMNSGWRTSDLKPLYILNLTARGAPLGDGLDGVFEFMDLGRSWIVKGFASLTTSSMHSVWKRLDES